MRLPVILLSALLPLLRAYDVVADVLSSDGDWIRFKVLPAAEGFSVVAAGRAIIERAIRFFILPE
jgi:hypothetical protein